MVVCDICREQIGPEAEEEGYREITKFMTTNIAIANSPLVHELCKFCATRFADAVHTTFVTLCAEVRLEKAEAVLE